MAAPTILHADLDSFFAAVEQRDDLGLRGRPVIVGGGVVLAASYEARSYGVHAAMGGTIARRLCPQAVVVPPRMDAYAAASRDVFGVFADTTPLVEAVSIDEAFLDVGGLARLAGPPLQIAVRLRAAVRDRVGLPITVGVARTKFLAKVASRSAKPDGLLLVPPEHELAFLHPLPIERMWGVGPATAATLHSRGITTVADIAALSEGALVAILGPFAGRHVFALATNRDPRPVDAGRRRRSIGAQRALGRGAKAPGDVDAALVGLVDRVCRRLRAPRAGERPGAPGDGGVGRDVAPLTDGRDSRAPPGRLARTVALRLRFDDFTRTTRARTLEHPTSETHVVLGAARDLLATAATSIDERGCTLVGVTVSNLAAAAAVQLALPFDRRDGGALDRTLDRVRDRFGSAAISTAVLLGRDQATSPPVLPD